jgi:uncharacterized repeat protein (TIGR01451 family)
MRSSYIFAVLATLVSSLVLAQGGPPSGGALSLKTVVQKIVEREDASGEVSTELVPVDVAVPGDEVVYTVTFTNVGGESAENVLITNPIPEQMRYEPGTAFGPGAAIEYSADGGLNYAQPNELRVSSNNGSQRIASADEYTHIRWELNTPLEPGAQGIARFRAVVR